MKKNRITFLVCLFSAVMMAHAWAQTAAQTDSEIWNEGVSFYRENDTTNALRVLRPLLLSKSHGPRAAEIIAKIAHDAAHRPGETNIIRQLEESAAAAQIAYQARPNDARLSRNFSRAIDGLSELRENERIRAALARGEANPVAKLRDATHEIRDVLSVLPTLRTNEATRAVARADQFSRRVDQLADVFWPVKEAICQAMTNDEASATISRQVNQAREKTLAASIAIEDFSDDSYTLLAEAENDFTRMLKATILPPEAMRENLTAQSNALLRAEKVNARAWQTEALDFTRAFRARFPAWAKAYEQRAQSDTNQPPFTAEAQEKIATHAMQLEKTQLANHEHETRENHEDALRHIREILELLPKEKGGGAGQNQPNQAPQNQPNQKNQQQQNQQNEASDQNANDETPQSSENDEASNDDETREKNDRENEAAEDDNREKDDREVESVLRKAQERSDEHEADKRARQRKAPLPPNARDW